MASSIQQISPTAANTDPVATTTATAATASTKSKNAVQAVQVDVPQDTVTISAQANAIANSVAAQTASAKGTPVAPATANTNAAPIAATAANAIALASATSSTLALEQQVQQLSFQGLSASEIAANLNIPVSEVQIYLTGTQATSAAQAAPPPQTAGINNSASAATTPATPKIQLY
jgi:DNA-directed RNA polymerase specialized sigma24 family protein